MLNIIQIFDAINTFLIYVSFFMQSQQLSECQPTHIIDGILKSKIEFSIIFIIILNVNYFIWRSWYIQTIDNILVDFLLKTYL